MLTGNTLIDVTIDHCKQIPNLCVMRHEAAITGQQTLHDTKGALCSLVTSEYLGLRNPLLSEKILETMETATWRGQGTRVPLGESDHKVPSAMLVLPKAVDWRRLPTLTLESWSQTSSPFDGMPE